MNQLTAMVHNKKQVMEIINNHWMKLAKELNIPIRDVNDTAITMRGSSLIKLWLKRSEKKANWNWLLSAMEQIGLRNVVLGMKDAIQRKSK